jgi:lipopolysaccharide export system protein LptA
LIKLLPLLLLFFSLCPLFVPCVRSEEPVKKRNELPIQIRSNELSAEGNGKIATFIGDVIARQGDVTIYCDRMVVRYGDEDRDVSRVEALGNVRIIQGNRQGHAGKATYDNRTGTITLEDNPRVNQGEDAVTGKVITFHLDDQKSVVTGAADKRVEAIINPKGQGTDVRKKP